MAVVVDASAVGAIAFRRARRPYACRAPEGRNAAGPDAHRLRAREHRLEESPRTPESAAQIQAALDAASRLRIQRVPVRAVALFRVARDTRLTVYDAAYLWLARTRDAELVTLDRRLADAVRS